MTSQRLAHVGILATVSQADQRLMRERRGPPGGDVLLILNEIET
jgi:hypothetical protein